MNNQFYGAPIGQEYNPGSHQYYQPAAPQQYGNVYYNQASQDPSYDSAYRSKEGSEALNRLFGDIKSNKFDINSFPQIQQRLSEFQGLQLPTIAPSGIPPAYQPVSGDHLPQSFALPPMSNVKSREDLTSIDRILEQMSNAVYESDAHAAANNYGSNSHYVNYNTHYGRSQPAAPPSSMTGIAAQALPSHHQNGSVSEQSSTSGLTPPSSAQSYTSGHSPLPSHLQLQQSSHAQMYPSLPTSAGMDGQYPTGANPPTLGPFGEDSQARRYSGGMLQRAQPARREANDSMDVTSEGSVTPSAAAKKASPPAGVIDPNLDPALTGGAGPADIAEATKPAEKSAEDIPSTDEGTAEQSGDRPAAPEGWLETTRFLEYLRGLVHSLQARFDQEESQRGQDLSPQEQEEGKEEAAIRQLQNAAQSPLSANKEQADTEMADVGAEEGTPKADAKLGEEGVEVGYPKLSMN